MIDEDAGRIERNCCSDKSLPLNYLGAESFPIEYSAVGEIESKWQDHCKESTSQMLFSSEEYNMDVSMVLNLQGDLLNEQANVSSKAVIKYKEPDFPVPFKQLKEDTNLNSPPKNWLRSNLSGKFFDGSLRKKKQIDLSSFKMATNYLDHVGNVDVISDAENIKRLLKTPYSDGGLSMAVHRIQNTLLISEFNVPEIISTASQSPDLLQKLEWLKRLYCEVVGVPQDSEFPKKKRNREHSRAQNMLSKFLHYSIEDPATINEQLPSEPSQLEIVEPVVECSNADALQMLAKEDVFISSFEDASRHEFESQSPFQRDIIWTLDDITMLVGSDMPIFGGGRFPAVSLRLRDASKPVNILTGLDYWLDNLMCNVPELLMCYHLEGIVQKYEIVLTEDLPNLEGCRFSPKVVQNIAQDILSFLKSKCTKEGHTYWLFKGSKSDIVKLYDLTSICNEEPSGDSLNPFTLPVASLLYRIANNMIANGISCRKDAVAACSLLQNCILLLEKENHHELMLAAHYLLAHLYMQDSFPAEDSTNPSFEDEQSAESDLNNSEEAGHLQYVEKGNAWLDATREERCRATIKFVIQALRSYDVVSGQTTSRRSLTYESMTYDDIATDDQEKETEGRIEIRQPLVARKGNDESVSVETRMCKWFGVNTSHNALGDDINLNLSINAVSAYSTLAELSISKEKYGRALRYLKVALIAVERIPSPRPTKILCKHAKINMMVGDISLILAHKRVVSREDFVTLSEDDADFVRIFTSDITEDSTEMNLAARCDLDELLRLSSEELLIKAVSWYEESLSLSPSDEEDSENIQQVLAVTARLGNVRNELGVFYMNMASNLLKEYGDPTSEEQNLWKKSYQYFETGIKAFLVINDKSNMALLYSNTARLMRLCAQAYGNSTRRTKYDSRSQFTKHEKLYFNKAFEFYQKAMSCLESNKSTFEIRNQISFDLSGAYFKMACMLQDFAPLSSLSFEEISKEVQSLMMKSLHFSEEEENRKESPRYKDIRIRIGKIHRRIASLYHHALRNKSLNIASKKLKSLADLHYNKAYIYLDEEHSLLEYLSTLTEHVGLKLQVESNPTSNIPNIKRLKAALIILMSKMNIGVLRKAARVLEFEETKIDAPQANDTYVFEERNRTIAEDDSIFLISFECSLEVLSKTVSLFNLQLNNVLKDLVLAFTSKEAKKATNERQELFMAKKMYEIYLRKSAGIRKHSKMIEQTKSTVAELSDVIELILTENIIESLI